MVLMLDARTLSEVIDVPVLLVLRTEMVLMELNV